MADEVLLWFIIALTFTNIVFTTIFLFGIRTFIARISPIIDKFVNPSGGFKLPTWKEAVAVGLMKLVESIDFKSVLPQLGPPGGRR